jgi:hypothetical protein
VLVDNLPGFPDNIARGTDGLIWIAIGSPRNATLDLLAPRPPALRKMLWALPEALLPKPADTVWVQAVDERGRLVHDLQTTTPGFSMVTGVREHAVAVWLGSSSPPRSRPSPCRRPGPSNPRPCSTYPRAARSRSLTLAARTRR